MLFALETAGGSAERHTSTYWRELASETGVELDPEARDYAERLVRGVDERLAELDEILRKASTNWRLERMARVDRNLLRLGAYELLAAPDVPRAVILDESVELAKRYGTEDSRSFVNGVLDRVAELVGRIDTDRP